MIEKLRRGGFQVGTVAKRLGCRYAAGLLVIVLVLGADLAVQAQVAVSAQGQALPAWQSFQNGGRVLAGKQMPVHWSHSQNVAWKAELEGYGQSAPVVRGQQVFVTTTSGKNKEKYHLACFDLRSGEKLWQKDFDNPSPEKNTSYVSRAAPTPALDGNGLCAFFEGGLLVAVSLQGEVRWSRNLVEEFGPITARHGLASSVEQNARQAFVWVERSDAPYLLAVEKETGQTVWKVAGVGATSWSTPRLVPIDEQVEHLVCSASGQLVGFDPVSGERLWEFKQISNNTSCTPFPLGRGRFLIGASDGRGEENAGKGAVSNGVIQIAKTEAGEWQASFIWQAKKATSSFGSPVAADGTAFLVNRVGSLFRLDLKTGQASATKRLDSGGIWATPLIADGKLYVFGQKGTTSIFDLESQTEVESNSLWKSPEAVAPGERSMGSPVLYAAAAASPYLILRRGDMLYAIGGQP